MDKIDNFIKNMKKVKNCAEDGLMANKKQKISGNSGNDFYPCDEKVRGSSSSVEKEQIGRAKTDHSQEPQINSQHSSVLQIVQVVDLEMASDKEWKNN